MQRLLLLWLLAGACTAVYAQKRLLIGGNIGAATAYLLKQSQEFEEPGGGAYGSLHFDYQLTSRLSINTQLQYQSEKHNTLFAGMFYQDVRLRTKRLIAGITEYLPVGNHALYMNLGFTLAQYSATGNRGGNANNVKLFKEQGFQPWNVGWGIHAGYMFRFGLSLQTGLTSDFTALYRGNDGKVRHQQFQLIQLGYLPGFHKREGIDRWNRKKKKR
jgi:hypothetical protein